jgi:cytoskeletal protein CcmA (bactofilin family)
MKKPATYFSANGSDSIIGAGVLVEGSLEVDGDLTVEGEIRGEIRASGGLIAGINSMFWSNITADTASISGKVVGNIQTAGKTTIREMGSVTGDVDSERLTILPGGVFVGRSRVTGVKNETRA